jgi:DNA-nicking Smr family endonuclease
MNFGDILSKWEQTPGHARIVNKDAEADNAAGRRLFAENIREMRPEASIDLHGKTREEAWSDLDGFVSRACAQGLRKILIVHGKGNHPGSDGALAKMVGGFIECDYRLGASGHPDARHGGNGATWVMLKSRGAESVYR